METTNVSKNFSSNKFTDETLVVLVQHVIASMTGNSNFTDPDPTLELVNASQENFAEAVAKALGGTKQDTADKNEKRESLEQVLKNLADYVQRISVGNEVIILSSGFDVYKKPEPVGPLPTPENFNIKAGDNKGCLLLSCDTVPHANFYEFEYTDAPVKENAVWIKRTSTKKQLLIEGLESGNEYALRVAAAASDPSRQWSTVAYSFVL